MLRDEIPKWSLTLCHLASSIAENTRKILNTYHWHWGRAAPASCFSKEHVIRVEYIISLLLTWVGMAHIPQTMSVSQSAETGVEHGIYVWRGTYPMAPIFPNFSVPPPQLRKRYEARQGGQRSACHWTKYHWNIRGQGRPVWLLLVSTLWWVSCPFTFISFECALLLAVSVWE